MLSCGAITETLLRSSYMTNWPSSVNITVDIYSRNMPVKRIMCSLVRFYEFIFNFPWKQFNLIRQNYIFVICVVIQDDLTSFSLFQKLTNWQCESIAEILKRDWSLNITMFTEWLEFHLHFKLNCCNLEMKTDFSYVAGHWLTYWW
jgi:hypothetical protein